MKQHESLPSRDVLVVVDVQHDFIDGSLAVRDGEQVIAPLNHVARMVRAHLGRVAYTRDWHPASTPHFDVWPVHCVADTEGAAFHDDLDITAADVVLSKGMGQTDGYSGVEGVAYDGTTLESLIDPAGRSEEVRVFIGGLATDYCDKATAVDLAHRFCEQENVTIYAMQDAMRAVNLHEGDEAAALADMATAGVKIISVDDALRLIDRERLEH